MAWTYGPDFTTDKDKVRLLIGDTDTTDQQFADEEIAFFVSENGSYKRAAIYAAESLAAKFAREVDYAIGQEAREFLSQRSAAYRALADRLRLKALTALAPIWGGHSISDKISDLLDTDEVKPIFRKDMETEPGTDPDLTEPALNPPVPYW